MRIVNKKGPLTAGALAAVLIVCLAACAPTVSESEGAEQGSDDGAGAIAAVEWSAEVDCAQCHANEAQATAAAESFAGVHASENVSCLMCHNEEETLAQVHEGADSSSPATRLKKTEVSDETCLACHASSKDSDEFAQLTNGAVVADDKGTQVNPHDLTDTKDHGDLECSDCHASHDDVDPLEEGRSLCVSCHHSGVFECGTCHD